MPQTFMDAAKTPRLLARYSALSYPILREISVDPVAVKRVSGIDRLGNLTARTVEISLVLYRLSEHLRGCPSTTPNRLNTDLRDALATDLCRLISTRQHLLIALVPANRVVALQEFFGRNTAPGAGVDVGDYLLHQLSEEFLPKDLALVKRGKLSTDICENHLGRMDEPHAVVGMSPSAWLRSWAAGSPEQASFITTAFAGADSSTISSRNYKALSDAGAQLIPSTRLYRALHSPKFWAYVIVFVYSTLRALPVTFVRHFHGSVLLLWTMDVVTAIPYTWGLVAFFTAHKPWIRATGFAVTLITFIAPYVYFWSNGRGYSIWVNAVVVAMIAGAILYEAVNYLRDRAVMTGLRDREINPTH